MKTHLQVILFLLIPIISFSQETFFSSVTENEFSGNPLLSYTEDTKNKNYQVVTINEKNDFYRAVFTIYDSTMKEKTSTYFAWEKGTNDKITFLGSAFFQKKFYTFFSIVTEGDLKNELVAVQNDNSTLEIKSLDKSDIKSITNYGGYQVSFSPNYKTFLVLREALIEKGKNESVGLMVFDEMLNKVTDLSLSFSVMSKPNPVNKAFVTDRGDIYVIKKDREKADFKFYLYAYNAELKGWNQKQVNIPGKMISDIDAAISSSQEFIVAGFYNSFDVSSYEGYFYFRMDPSLKYTAKTNQRFSADFMSNFIGKKAASKEDAVITGYYFENLITAPDNQCYIIAEIEEQDFSTDTKIYKYGDIMYLHLDKEGNIRNSGMVKNEQETKSDDGKWSSFNYAVTPDTLHLFHNEVNLANSKSKFADVPYYGTYHTTLTKGSIVNTNPETKMILKNDRKLSFDPGLVYQTSDQHLLFILLSQDNKSYAIGKMKLK